jgi:hypothetical protein
MTKQEPKSKQTQREEEHEKRIKQGRLSFKSHRWPDMRKEKFFPSREQH